MADAYLRSTTGSDANDGTSWAQAEATLAAALVDAGVGGRVFMSDNHAETQASAMTNASSGTVANLTAVICVDDTGDPSPPTALATTGTVSTTASSSNMSFTGHAAYYGVSFSIAAGANALGNYNFTSATSWSHVFRSGTMTFAGSNNANRLAVASTANVATGLLELYSMDIQFSGTGQGINAGWPVKWYGGTMTLGTAPTGGLIRPLAGQSTLFEARGVDLTNLGTNAFMDVQQGCVGGYVDFIHCKIDSGHSVTTLVTGVYDGLGMPRIRLHQCTGSDTNFACNLMERDHAGFLSSDLTVYRVGGGSDGTTPYSHKLQAGTNPFYGPLYSPRYAIPIVDVGVPLSITVELFRSSAASTPTDEDVFVELEYLGTSGNTLGVITNTRRAILGTATTLTVSTATWIGGGATPKPCKVTINFTPTEPGFAVVRVGWIKGGGADIIYVDPPQIVQVAGAGGNSKSQMLIPGGGVVAQDINRRSLLLPWAGGTMVLAEDQDPVYDTVRWPVVP